MRDYAVYFFTLLIGIAVFYIFNAVSTQAAYMSVSERNYDLVELLDTMISTISIFVAIVLGLLIVYASRFLMKRRNNEFALYLMLGMGKGKISVILFLETVLIGLLSLTAGLLSGVALSQLMSAFVASLFEADMTAYRFMVSREAIFKTILYFAVMYLVVMVFNTVNISRCKLIDLMHSGKRSESVRFKNPAVCGIVFVLSGCALSYAYYMVVTKGNMLDRFTFMAMIVIGAVSTFLIFWSAAGFLLNIVQRMKKFYHRGLNTFTFRQIASRINTMILSMTIICLMLFVTICTLASSFSVRNNLNENITKLCPADFEIVYEAEAGYNDIISAYKQHSIPLTEHFKEYVHFHAYEDPELTLAVFLGDYLETVMEQYRFILYETAETIVSLSDYNRLMELYGKEPFSLEEDEFILLCDFTSMRQIRDERLKDMKTLEIMGHDLKPKYRECQDGFVDITSQHINIGIYVVPDSVADETYAAEDYFIGNYAAETKKEKESVEEIVRREFDEFSAAIAADLAAGRIANYHLMFNTKIDIVQASVGLGALFTFLGLYIGIVFLISCGAILALKELSGDVDSIGRYQMLRKLGVEERDIRGSLFAQTGIFFLLPLLLAIVHSVFGMQYANGILSGQLAFGDGEALQSYLTTGGVILVIYGGYFLVTYFSGKEIIKS